MFTIFSDEHFMKAALNEAKKGAAIGEVPVGAVIVSNNQIIAKAHNQTQQLNDVTAHAEMLAITAAADYLGAKYLHSCTLFITLEPCIMCAGALYWSQIDRIVVGASDDKRGFMRYGKALLHPKTKMELGVLESLSKELLQDFFSQKRRIR